MLSKALLAAAKAVEPIYVENVFQTWLYTGNGSTQTITNGIDLSGKGGLVWTKKRNLNGYNSFIIDSARNNDSFLIPNSTGGEASSGPTFNVVFNSNGFTDKLANQFWPGDTLASWTFREAAKFFDVVTYTGNGGSQTLSHSLGTTPGFVIIKRTDSTSDWVVWHRSFSLTNTAEGMKLNTTDAFGSQSGNSVWSSTTPMTSTTFGVQASGAGSWNTNLIGATYVAYLFAHDAGGFGNVGTDSVSACSSFTTDGSGNATITLGWEPQWVLVKKSSAAAGNTTDDWFLYDTMRGADVGSGQKLAANTTSAETINSSFRNISATGFGWSGSPSVTYIYIAIRRGPMKTPTSATSVFAPEAVTPSTGNSFTTGFPVDLSIANSRTAGQIGYFQDRLRGYPTVSSTAGDYPLLVSTNTNSESAYNNSSPYIYASDSNTSVKYGSNLGGLSNVTYAFRRAPGFFDVVAFRGSSSTFSVPHNLTVVPSLILIKKRIDVSGAGFAGWWVLSSEFSGGFISGGSTSRLVLNTDAAVGIGVSSVLNSLPTSTQLSLLPSNFNASDSFIAYLFATCPGVSKVGSYTGTGTTQQINCGFTAGARFVLIKRTDSTGDWYVWDSARGIIAGNDPYLLLNSTAAEVTNTDFVDTFSSGFEISSTAPAAINANGGNFIFLAVA